MPGQRAVTAGIRHRAMLPDSTGWLLVRRLTKQPTIAAVVAVAGSVGDQPAQRAGSNVEPAAGRAVPLAGRTDALVVMELSADTIRLATAAVAIRNGIDGLSLHLQQAMGCAPSNGPAYYVFANSSRTRLKLACGDDAGVWMCLPRLHRGKFF